MKTAYLNSNIGTEIYISKPELFEEMLRKIIYQESGTELAPKAEMLSQLVDVNRVCRLNKALYGLKQAGRQWYERLKEALRLLDLVPTKSDPCVFVDKNRDQTFVLIYVDDILIASKNSGRADQIKREFSRQFKIKDLGEAKYCLGIEIRQEKKQIRLSQASYIRKIMNRFGMIDCKPSRTPLVVGSKLLKEDITENREKIPYKELTGALMYVAMGTRPDIAHAVSVLCQFNNCHNESHWSAAKRMLRYLKGTINYSLNYTRDNEGLIGYVDVDWGNCRIDRKSYTGMAFILTGAAISWGSRKQRTVALSSTEAEYLRLTDAAKEAVYLIQFLKELGLEDLATVTLYNDKLGAAHLAQNPIHHARSKHIDSRCHFIREALSGGTIQLRYLPTEEMAAVVLTKALSSPKHENCCESMGIGPTEDPAMHSRN